MIRMQSGVSQEAEANNAQSPAIPTASLTGFPSIFALPMDNRTVRFIDITGSRIGRIPRNTAEVGSNVCLQLYYLF